MTWHCEVCTREWVYPFDQGYRGHWCCNEPAMWLSGEEE